MFYEKNCNLPVITGFENSARCSDEAAPNPECSSPNFIELRSEGQYSVCRNFRIFAWKKGEFIIYTVNGGTPIYIGRGDLTKQLYILAAFQNLIKSKRTFADYQYLDLRWDKQIIARERKS